MPKITDENYYLPEIFATNAFGIMSSGRTQPMLIRGVCNKSTDKLDYIVKFLNSISIIASCNELIASFIAMELGLHVAEPALILITPEFVDTLKVKDGYSNASKSIGVNFGCGYVEGYVEFTNNHKFTSNQLLQAKKIFSFDIFISNSDRRIDKHNLITNGERILIFDHELAFGFIMDIIKNPSPWIITDNEMKWIRNHYFFPVLKGNEHKFDEFVDKFVILGDQFWNKVFDLIPKEWMGLHIDKIKNNLSLLVQNKDVFKQELKRILL